MGRQRARALMWWLWACTAERPHEDTAAELDAANLSLSGLAGVWSGPVDSQTSAGDFPVMHMDLRPVAEGGLFGRSDLSVGNNLRMWLFEGEGSVWFRNGGEFLGVFRDSMTEGISADVDAWRFCAVETGCSRIDSVFSLDGDELTVTTEVNGSPHFTWAATRTAGVGGEVIGGVVEADWPTLSRLEIDVSWDDPLEEAATLWVALGTEPCLGNLACSVSRGYRHEVLGGSTGSSLTIEQVHPGEYLLNAYLDRDGNGVPSSGDWLVAIDRAVEIEGVTLISLVADFVAP